MASFYWYEREPELWANEQAAMSHFFPQFRYSRLDDGRLSWVGTVQPRGKAGLQWTLQLVYSNSHPNNTTYGGSIMVYSIDPDLDELAKKLGTIPHVLRDSRGHLYLCTARQEDFKVYQNATTSAASALGWACKWIFVFEEWVMNGHVGEEIFGHAY
jgi:hypothetical protein